MVLEKTAGPTTGAVWLVLQGMSDYLPSAL